MVIRLLLCVVVNFGWAALFAQPIPGVTNPPGKVHALVIGISKYQDPGIRSLQFAATDAEKFAGFLRSEAGGNVPAENIKLLLNERATTAEIDIALDQLMTKVEKSDRVYFYFAGHGDVETKTFANLGFLLAYNTPRFNYTRNAIRIEDVNLFVTTLSTQKNAEVIVITDACHSGKLAGDIFNGRRLVGNALRKIELNEVRLASCLPDQLSNESEFWGGGRGVFSYYLLKGLQGEAAKESGKPVTVGDIKGYLETAMNADQVLKSQNVKQAPVVEGNATLPLSLPVGFSKSASVRTSEIFVEPVTVFEDVLRKNDIENLIDFSKTDLNDPSKIRSRIFETILGKYTMEGEIYDPVSRFYKMAQSNPSYASMANEAIASVIHEKGQAVINAYLNGDLAELEKRNYYNIREGVYDRYVNMYRVALSLLQPEGRLYQRMLVASRYFEGLLVRLKMPLYPDGKSMVDSAMAILYHALSLEKNAAYIRNELANLHALKRNTDSSLFYYKKAMDLAPSWAVPPANMVGLYNQLGNQKLAKEAADKARQLQPDLVSLMMQEGVTEEQSGNWLRAEELQRRSLLSSDMHYFPYERLGYIHAATAKFAQADSFFYEAEKRRLGFYLPDPGLVATPVGFVSGPELMKSTGPCWVTPLSSPSSNPYVLILAANEYYAMKEYDSAAFYFEKALQLAPDNFIGMYHYGRLLFETNRLTEAEFYFGKANHLHTGNSIWDVLESRMLPDAPGLDSACLIRLLQGLHFPRVNCIYYLGRIYHSLGYYTRAEEAYREIFGISDMIHKTNGAHLLASLFSQLEKYLEAEKVWLQYTKDMQNLILHQEMRDNDILEDLISFAKEGVELRNFYRTMVKSDPDSYYWNSRYADHLFQLVSSNPGRYYSIEDKKEIPFEGAIDDELRDVRSWINNQNRFPFTMHPIEDSSLKFSIPLEWALGSAFSTNRNALLLADTDERMCKYHEQLAGLYIIVQKFDSAGMLYARALEFAHGNRDLRKKASESFWRGYQYSASFAQLDTLYQQKSLMVEDFIQYAQMAIQKGDQSTALMVLQSNEARLNGSPQTIQQLKGRSFFISGSDKVPGFFKDSLSGIMHDKDRFYAMAVYYAQKKHKDDALRWLEKSVHAGFDYSFLLKYDNAWAPWRNDRKWKQITDGIKPIQYQ